MAEPQRWSAIQLSRFATAATERFRRQRKNEPAAIYADFFQAFVPIFRTVIENALPALSDSGREVDRGALAEIIGDPASRVAFRYLAAPPISDDDLKTLAESRLSAAALRVDQDEAERVRSAVLSVIDPFRFPWIEAGRLATDQEKEIAVVSSAVLVASQRVGARRRNDAKKEQEERVKELLRGLGLREVRPRPIPLLEDGPLPEEFCGESRLGDTRADLVVRLPDRRYLTIECKVSNSAVNSFKRVNHEALGKARRWVNQFGTAAVVPAAVLGGVFNPDNLAAAQSGGLYLFWAHRLDDLSRYINACRPGAAPGVQSRTRRRRPLSR